jgi:predicted DNA-binding protein
MSDVVKDVRLTVRISAELRNRLKQAAKRTGTRESDLVRSGVEMRLAAEETVQTALDRVKKAGLIGIVKGAPPDLSTNRKYFDGFGEN